MKFHQSIYNKFSFIIPEFPVDFRTSKRLIHTQPATLQEGFIFIPLIPNISVFTEANLNKSAAKDLAHKQKDFSLCSLSVFLLCWFYCLLEIYNTLLRETF